MISFDLLIRMLADWFSRSNSPQGGSCTRGSGRSGGFRLGVPNSRSEEDYAIDMGWIVSSEESGRERVLDVTRTVLTELQAAVVQRQHRPAWPDFPRGAGRFDLPEPNAEIAGDTVNPLLRLWYGDRDDPTLEVTATPIYHDAA